MNHRIIARLDIKGPNLVKGIHLEGLRVLGTPADFARYYYENGADELIYQDVVASLYERNSLQDLISKTAREIFIPLTVGGGLRSIADIREVLRAGADKVALNTAVISQPNLIREASRLFGSSTIVVAIEAIRQADGSFLAYTDNGRNHTGVEVLGWAQQVEELGAGELVVTSVDNEGTGKGFNLELTQAIAAAVSIPVIAHGGAGCLEDVAEVLTVGGAQAAAVAAMLHYDYISSHSSKAASAAEGNTQFLDSGRSFSKIQPAGLGEIKNYLSSRGIPCRCSSSDPQEHGHD